MKNLDYSKLNDILGYKFNNEQLLLLAFTHSSYANFHSIKSNERVEFLGDSILNFTVTDFLYKNFDMNEGELSKIKAYLVSSTYLSVIIENLGVIPFLKCTNFNPTKSKNVMCDLFESIVGAIYLDSNLEKAQKFIYKQLKLTKELIEDVSHTTIDYKTKLQEFVQKCGKNDIVYRLIKKDGLSHKPIFTMELIINNEAICNASAENKKKAENKCAKLALDILDKSKK